MPIEVLEAGSMASAVSGWLGSRDLSEAATGEQISRIDASVNELPTCLLYFRDMMILERELFVTPRNHVIWARTSRVDDPRGFTVPKGFEREGHEHIRRVMHHLAGDGVHQDIWRMGLPLCAQTSWTARLTFRDGVRMVRYFIDVAHIANPLLGKRLIETASELTGTLEAAFAITPDTMRSALMNFKAMPIQQLPNYLVGDTRHTIGEVTSMQMWLPIATRAQLVRHREITISDNFVHHLAQPLSEQHNIGTRLYVQAVALTSTWRTVLGKRTCWMAQADLWAPLARLFGKGIEGLPCAGGKCPYAEDAKLRLAGQDPGAPCPRYAKLTKTPMTRPQIADAELQASRIPDLTTLHFWQSEIDQVIAID
jgi:hypothetical protein